MHFCPLAGVCLTTPRREAEGEWQPAKSQAPPRGILYLDAGRLIRNGTVCGCEELFWRDCWEHGRPAQRPTPAIRDTKPLPVGALGEKTIGKVHVRSGWSCAGGPWATTPRESFGGRPIAIFFQPTDSVAVHGIVGAAGEGISWDGYAGYEMGAGIRQPQASQAIVRG